VGLTNVTYDVQVTTNLVGTWATLGKISSTQTNFSFTDLNNTESLLPFAMPLRGLVTRFLDGAARRKLFAPLLPKTSFGVSGLRFGE
jgi:hypothetical protein